MRKDVRRVPTLDTTESGPGQAAAMAKAASGEPVSRGYREEIEHWAWSVRNFDPNDPEKHQPRCHPNAGN